MSRTRLTVVICVAEIFGMASFATFPALLPTFKGLWSLSNTEAGWISSAYYLGYLVGVPLLTAWTDRRDARRHPRGRSKSGRAPGRAPRPAPGDLGS